MKIISNQGIVIATEIEKVKNGLPKLAELNQSDLANITFESMQDKMKIAILEETSATLAFEIMQMKMGGN